MTWSAITHVLLVTYRDNICVCRPAQLSLSPAHPHCPSERCLTNTSMDVTTQHSLSQKTLLCLL